MSQLELYPSQSTIEVFYQIVHATTGRIRLHIPRISCDLEFASKLEWTLKSSHLILEVRINPIIGCIVVHYTPEQITFSQIKMQLADAINYAVQQDFLVCDANQFELEVETEINYLERLGLPLVSLGAAVITTALELPIAFFVGGLILITAIPLFQSTLREITEERKLTVDVLESLWTVLHTVEGAMVAPALALSMEGLWTAMRDQTATKVNYQEINLQLDGFLTHVKRLGREQQVLIEDVQIGEKVVVYPGDMIPVDGYIFKGKATIDEEKLTGLSNVVVRGEGDKVYASTFVVEGKITIFVEQTGKDTQIGKLIDLINHAPIHDTRIADFAEEAGNLTIMPILTLSGLLFGITGDVHRALALLQLNFASGIRISATTAVLTAIDYAARCGVYIRCGHALEMLGRLDTIVFDKTGTLTQGNAEVVNIQTASDQITPLEILSLAAATEQGLNHPSAKAIVHYAQARGIFHQSEFESWEYKIGKGVIAQLNGQQILLGSRKFLTREGIDLKPIRRKYPDLRHSGHTHVYVARDRQLLGVISLSNPLRQESANVIATLQEAEIYSYMLTGDHAKAANTVAKQVGIPNANIHVEAFFERKVDVLKELKKEGKVLAYVGEGMNDAVGLAYADVAVSFAEGSQIARQSADVVLMDNNLEGLVKAIAIARKTKEIIEQNITLVAVPNISVVFAGVIFGLDPILGVFINSGFTILAELNGLRTPRGIIKNETTSAN